MRSTSRHCVLALLDVSKAFDKINRPQLLRKLGSMGVRGHLLNMIASFLSERTHCTKVDNCISTSLSPSNGSPQGSALSMHCFLSYFNDSIDTSDSMSAGLFVDDAALYSHDNSMPKLIDRFNISFKSIHKWSLANSVMFDSEKFKILDLTEGRASRSKRKLYFWTQATEVCNQRYLSGAHD